MSELMNTQNSYHLLRARVAMCAAEGGYRAAIDPVLLAASVPVQKGERILDVGCGTGAAALCLATRISGVHVTGVDVQEPLIELARDIAAQNGLESQTQFEVMDLLRPDEAFRSISFDHVMANPPHHKKGSGNPSPDPLKAAANVEGEATLADWVSFCFSNVKEGGSVTFVHRFDRLAELTSLMAAKEDAVSVFPLWPKIQGEGAKRVLVQARKGVAGKSKQADGLVLHTMEDEYTEQAHSILREAAALVL